MTKNCHRSMFFISLCSVFIVVFTVNKQVFWKSVDVPPPAIVTAKSTRLGSDLEQFSREKCPPNSIIKNIIYMAPTCIRTVLHCLLWVHLKEGPHLCWSLCQCIPALKVLDCARKDLQEVKSFISQDTILTWYQYKKTLSNWWCYTGESTAAHCHGLTKAILFSSPV